MDVKSIIDKNREALIIPDGIVVINKDLKIIAFNEAAARISGYSEDEIIGENCRILFYDKEGTTYIIESLKYRRSFTNLSVDLINSEGEKINVLASVNPVVRDDKILSSVFVFRNTQEMLSLAEEVEIKTKELTDQKNKLDAIFNSHIEGTFTIDHDWIVTSFNSSAEKITGYQKKEAIGKKCWEIFNSSLCRNGCHMEQTMHKGKSTIGNELEIIRKDERRVPIRVNSAILINNENEKIGAVETFIDISEIKNLSEHLDEKYKFENIVGRSHEIQYVISIIENVSQTDSSALITGESGTGKELVARAIHLNSSRRTGPFVAVNCSAFAESLIESELFGHEKGAFTGAVKSKMGRFETANGGTLFLDEIGDLSMNIQTKLLRVLETKEIERVGSNKTIKIDTRILAATNKDLEKEIEAGKFREDLFYRINVINVHLPPLRERKDDLHILIHHFLEKFREKFGKKIDQFSSPAFETLLEYNWPGNIRELENVIEHCFILCDGNIIQQEHLPARIKKAVEDNHKSISPNENIDQAEKQIITNTLKKNSGSRKQTAEDLGIDPSTLWRKMKKFGLL